MPRKTKPRETYDREILNVMRLRDAFNVDTASPVAHVRSCIDAANVLIQTMFKLENERSKNVRTKDD